ncbi:hypothetical protein L3V77_08885 [Vibrio sp. DW001]|uniref:hypothetical protein n=1 Tax=Vibrio sp. DW001 TaxID=2912315 RepID=UPI0023B0EF16|nr:hypothetical protein [Vibrio sp. DW001]WED25202.1 hypothetical protein L3V77_08885 [Vibrio sp. DW001]
MSVSITPKKFVVQETGCRLTSLCGQSFAQNSGVIKVDLFTMLGLQSAICNLQSAMRGAMKKPQNSAKIASKFVQTLI